MNQKALQDIEQEDSGYYWDYLLKNPHSVRRKAAIQYAGRSGSYMLSGLLDGHSHILSFIYTAEFGLYEFMEKLFAQGPLDIPAFRKELRENIPGILDIGFYSCEVVAEKSRNIDFELEEFLQTVDTICGNLEQEKIDFDLAYNIIYIAFGKTINSPLQTKEPILVIQRHVPLSEEKLKNAFDSLKNLEVIVTVRNPVKSLDSHFFHHWAEYPARPWLDYIRYLLSIYRESLNVFFNMDYCDRGYVIHFEDLHTRPEQTMRVFCHHFAIPYEEVLLQETLAGKLFFFNSDNKAMHGSSAARATDTSFKMLSRSDVCLIEYLFKDVIADLGYDFFYKPSILTYISTLFPCRFQFSCIKRTWQETDDLTNKERLRILLSGIKRYYRDIRKLKIEEPYRFNFIRADVTDE